MMHQVGEHFGWRHKQETTVAIPMAELDLHRAALKGDWELLIRLYKERPTLANADLTTTITVTGDTLIHMAVRSRRTDVVGELLQLLPERVRRVANKEGNTSIHEASRTGNVDMAKLILDMDESLVWSRNELGETALFWAAMYGRKDMLFFLSPFAKEEEEGAGGMRRSSDGTTILHSAIVGQFYDLALEMLEMWPDLAFGRDERGVTALRLLSDSPSSFKSRTIYSHRYVGSSPFLSLEKIAIAIYACIPMADYRTRYSNDDVSEHSGQWHCHSFKDRCMGYLRSGVQRVFLACPGLRNTYIAKVKHRWALQLARCLISEEKQWGYGRDGRRDPHKSYPCKDEDGLKRSNSLQRPLILATRWGIEELVQEIVKAFPESVEFVDDATGKNLLHIAVEHRQEYIVELLKKKEAAMAKMLVGIDKKKNTILHLAAKLGKEDRPWRVIGPFHHMQWECIWYQVFSNTHKAALKEGKKWMKEVSNTSMLMSTLLVTVMVQAAFTVPGGNDSNTGLPVLLHTADFTPFIQYVALALFFSVISVGTFLSILTSPYEEDDFYASLSIKFIVAATALFNSVVYTVSAFCQAYFLVTGWSFSSVLTAFDIALAAIGFTHFVHIYISIMVLPLRYLCDSLFI